MSTDAAELAPYSAASEIGSREKSALAKAGSVSVCIGRPRVGADAHRVWKPAFARSTCPNAQSLSLTAGTFSGDGSGTSIHQAADASGKYVAAEWAVANEFPVAINRGFVRCVLRAMVTVQTGYKLVPGTAAGSVTRLAIAQFAPLRLNGAVSHVRIETAVSIDNGAPATAASNTSSGPMSGATLSLDRPADAPAIEGACSTATKSTFQLIAQVDAAAASNYVSPWPPEPYAGREVSSVGSVRLFYTVLPCTTRSAVPQRPGAE